MIFLPILFLCIFKRTNLYGNSISERLSSNYDPIYLICIDFQWIIIFGQIYAKGASIKDGTLLGGGFSRIFDTPYKWWRKKRDVEVIRRGKNSDISCDIFYGWSLKESSKFFLIFCCILLICAIFRDFFVFIAFLSEIIVFTKCDLVFFFKK